MLKVCFDRVFLINVSQILNLRLLIHPEVVG